MPNAVKSAAKTAPGRPFTGKGDARNGRGPRKGASNAGRPPDKLKAEMAKCRAKAVEQIAKKLKQDDGLDPDQLIKVVDKFAPPGEKPDTVIWFLPVLPSQSIDDWARNQPGILGG